MDKEARPPTDPAMLAKFWEEQAKLYAVELQRIYQSERNERAALAQAQAQLILYADDVRAAYRSEQARRQEIQRAYVETIQMLAASVEARDPYTGGHLERVTDYCLALGREIGLGPDELNQLQIAAILHDIGKISIQDAVLRKRGPLDPDEWTHMRQHAIMGAEILRGISFLEPIVPAVRHHHERYDGTGYPDGLEGREIPVGGRIIAVADAYDAMTTTRPYRPGRSAAAALAELQAMAGSQFDPDLVAAFGRVLARHGEGSG